MKLMMYGGDDPNNHELNALAVSMTGKRNPRLVYIPACSYESEADFHCFIKDFRKLGVTKFIYFPVDIPFDNILFNEVMQADLIHLSGGNTYYFLKHLRESMMINALKEFVRKGGVLTGLSAGAIMQTPHIGTAGFPSFDRDDNDEHIVNMRSLGLANFEFFPHYKNSQRYERELMKYSKTTSNIVYAAPDGCGVAVDGNKLIFVGKVFCFYEGRKLAMNQSPPIKKTSTKV